MKHFTFDMKYFIPEVKTLIVEINHFITEVKIDAMMPEASHVYRKIGREGHSTPAGVAPFTHDDRSINMQTLRVSFIKLKIIHFINIQ